MYPVAIVAKGLKHCWKSNNASPEYCFTKPKYRNPDKTGTIKYVAKKNHCSLVYMHYINGEWSIQTPKIIEKR